MNALVPASGHLTETALQLLADGSLRGPEGMAARAHADSCPHCAAELRALQTLSTTLSALRDPLPPVDFLGGVMSAVAVRETQLVARRQIKLAAIPAFAIALTASLGWAFSEGLVQRLNDLRSSLTLARTVVEIAAPVVSVTRLPIALAAFVATGAILFALARTLRHGSQDPRSPIEA